MPDEGCGFAPQTKVNLVKLRCYRVAKQALKKVTCLSFILAVARWYCIMSLNRLEKDRKVSHRSRTMCSGSP